MKIRDLAHGRNVRRDAGFVLLDALVAVVIFSIGILGMVALQASAVSMTTGANYRINAAILTDQVIAQMWGDSVDNIGTDYGGTSGTGGTQYTAWLNTIDCSSGSTASTNCLPGAKANPPTIDVTKTNPTQRPHNYQITVTLHWRAPDDPNVHTYVAITQIGQ
jgi:type IV pilus assembly protein PilV